MMQGMMQGVPVVHVRVTLQIGTRAVIMSWKRSSSLLLLAVGLVILLKRVDVGVAGDPTVCRWVPSKVCRSTGAAAASSSIYPAAVSSALYSSWKQARQEVSSWEPEWPEGQSGSQGRWPNSPEVTTAETSTANSQALRRSALQFQRCLQCNHKPIVKSLSCSMVASMRVSTCGASFFGVHVLSKHQQGGQLAAGHHAGFCD